MKNHPFIISNPNNKLPMSNWLEILRCRTALVFRATLLFTIGMVFLFFKQVFAIDGTTIMQQVDARDDGNTRHSKTTMTLTNKQGSQRVRSLVSYSKDYDNETKTVMVFLSPADVKGVGHLNYDYKAPNKDDDTWLFLPAMKKVRRIAGSSRNDYFMGTDFTYDDMGDRQVAEDTHTLLGEEVRDGHNCWIVQSIPVDTKKSMYGKTVSRVRQDNYVVVFVEFYDRQGKLLKTLTNRDIQQINGIWIIGDMLMENVQDKHQTRIINNEIVLNEPIDDSLFRVSTLERGRVR